MTPEPIHMWAVTTEWGDILHFTIRSTRSEAIDAWKSLFDPDSADREWEKWRRKRRVRAIRVIVTAEQDQ